MAQVTLTITGTIDGKAQTISKSATIDDTVLPFFLSFYRMKFGTQVDGLASAPLATDEAALDALATDLANRGVQEVRAWLLQQAQAQIKIPDISVVPL
jgi:hypothetical protein